jgi:HSP20 family protein
MFKESGLWNEIDKIRGGLDDLLKTAGFGGVTAGRYPPYTLHSRPEEYLAQVELAGVPKESVEIVYRDRQLTLRGSKRPPQFDEGTPKGELLRDETFTGAFEKSIPLPTEVDGDRISARFQDGLLTIRLPKLEKEKPRNVKID